MTVSREQLDAALGFRVSDEQWDVISAPLEPAVVVAGAGSGKTTAMAARVAWLMAGGILASGEGAAGAGDGHQGAALGLTFTNKAAGSLLAGIRASLRALGVAPGDQPEPLVQTYNAYAARILTQHGMRLGREPGAGVLQDGARHRLAYRVVCRTSLPLDRLGKSPMSLTGDLLDLDDQCSELDVDPQALAEFDDKLVSTLESFQPLHLSVARLRDAALLRSVLARLVLEWREEKRRRDVLDFTDQTRLALQIVRTFPDVASSLRASAPVVLLDEYQDTSLAQRLLLQQVFGDGHPVTAVGDPCQAIYGWRGASIDNIESFPVHFPVLRDGVLHRAPRYTLSANRRSDPVILAVANEVFSTLRSRHDGVVALAHAGHARGPGQVECGLFETADEERAWIVERIKGIGTRQRAWGSVAVLATTGRELAELATALQAVGVPTQVHGAAGLLRQPVVVDLRSTLEVLVDPVANPALIRLLAGPRWRIGVRDLAALGARALALAGGGHRAVTTDVADALDEAVAGADPTEAISLSDAVLDLGDPAMFSAQAVERLGAFALELRSLRRHVGEPILELILRISRVTGLDVECALAGPDQQRAWSAFCDLAAQFTDLDGSASIGAFVARLADAERFDVDLPVADALQPDAVQLMTIHKAKGLEFPHVFIPAVASGAFPGGVSRGEWVTSASAVPWPIRIDEPTHLAGLPDLREGLRDKDLRAYRDLLRDLRDADDERLLYVAMTRAMSTLVVTGHWWGSTQSKPRGPDPYLTLVREACLDTGGEIVAWAPEPTSPVNPTPRSSAAERAWPQPGDPAARQVAARVSDAMHAHPALPGMPVEMAGLSSAESAIVAGWDQDARLLMHELRAARAMTVQVRLPASVAAGTLVRALRDPDGLAIDLARPMPSRPSPYARRGTAFHAWVEARYGQQSLLDPDDLPGASDADIASDADLDALKAAFERSAFASRVPVAVEQPFAIVLGGRVVTGRIDAVFEANGRYDVIDWKTGSLRWADPGQLAVYALAWSQLRGIPVADIDAGFLMVASGEVVRPAEWRAILDDLLDGPLDGPLDEPVDGPVQRAGPPIGANPAARRG